MALIEKTEFANKKNAKEKCEEFIKKSLSQKGDDVVLCNIKAIGLVNNFVIEIKTKDEWKNISIAKIDEKLQKNTCFSQKNDDFLTKNNCYDDYYNNYIKQVLELNGDELPVSKVNMFGENQTGTSKFEKRNVANKIPVWKSEKCIQCGKCSFVCPHAVVRAKLLTEEELKNAPTTLKTKEALLNKNLQFCLEVSPEDCLACGLCENVCPTKALTLEPRQNNFDEVKQNFEWTKNITNEPKCKNTNLPLSPLTMQFAKPYFEFSGACAGCGETPYIKLLSQMFGKNLIIANATGCSSIYGGSAPTCPYTKDENGFGPAWANSLFEDNAEFGLGIEKANRFKREQFKNRISSNLQNFDDKHKALLENG